MEYGRESQRLAVTGRDHEMEAQRSRIVPGEENVLNSAQISFVRLLGRVLAAAFPPDAKIAPHGEE